MIKLAFTRCSDWESTNGIDIELHSKAALAKVRSGAYPFYVDELRKLSVEAQGKQALAFSRKEYSEEIVKYADRSEIALFKFDDSLTCVRAANQNARTLENSAASQSEAGETRRNFWSRFSTNAETSNRKGRSQPPR